MKTASDRWITCCTILLSSAISVQTQACTWFIFKNDKGNAFIGRTMEWPGDLHGEMAIVPRGYKFGSIKTRYGFVGLNHKGVVSDGMNEHGVAISGLWLGASKYWKKGDADCHIVDLIPNVLGNTKSVDEAVAYIKKTKFYTSGSDVTSGLALTIHFSITDASGKTVVVEFVEGERKIYENKVGVMTNDPPYDKHLAIWSAYDPSKFSEETFEGFDYSPEGRFCRMAAINATQAKVPTDEAAVNRAWSMINTVDIPQGILYWRWVNDHPQFTSYSIVADVKNRVYYLRTYDNYDIRKIDLSKIDFAAVKPKSVTIFGKAKYRDFEFE